MVGHVVAVYGVYDVAVAGFGPMPRRAPGRSWSSKEVSAAEAAGAPSGESWLVIDRYASLRESTLPGQAHHLNQAAALIETLYPSKKVASIKLQGNIVCDVGAPHTLAHRGQWRASGVSTVAPTIVPTNLRYTQALQQSLRAAGLSEAQVQQAVQAAIRERVRYGLLGGNEVPRIPQPIPNLSAIDLSTEVLHMEPNPEIYVQDGRNGLVQPLRDGPSQRRSVSDTSERLMLPQQSRVLRLRAGRMREQPHRGT